MPVWSWRISGDAAVPPSMPSTTTTSAPAFAASLTSSYTRVAPSFTKIGTCQSVASRSSSILMIRSSGPSQSGCRAGLRWSTPGGSSRAAAISGESLDPRSRPPVAGLAPCPTVSSIPSAALMRALEKFEPREMEALRLPASGL